MVDAQPLQIARAEERRGEGAGGGRPGGGGGDAGEAGGGGLFRAGQTGLKAGVVADVQLQSISEPMGNDHYLHALSRIGH